ncbi:uncharacterized protein LOC123875885 [Maniola jurtina]|uniref:uncharacterized protein LOC123875885 n=1 Tax=Maniola jurtina TaxID=191418 RepID=UPI001E686AA5|nr:uncharacterized protein LOC123875885 [Maniola jurtina]
MAISGCTNGLVASGLLALVLLPTQYYFPSLLPRPRVKPEPRPLPAPPPATTAHTWFFLEFPAHDLIFTLALILLAIMTYLCEWIQRKLMERRLQKLNQYLRESVERLRGWDARQERLESTLRMVQSATSEYELLLFLLLRRARAPPPDKRAHDRPLLPDRGGLL